MGCYLPVLPVVPAMSLSGDTVPPGQGPPVQSSRLALYVILAVLAVAFLFCGGPIAAFLLAPQVMELFQGEPAVVLTYEVDPEFNSGGQPVDISKVVAAVERRVSPRLRRVARVKSIGGQRIEVGVYDGDEANVARVARIVESAGTIEFRILANNQDDKPLIERAQQSKAKTVLDSQGNRIGWWVPVIQREETGFLRGGGEIAVRSAKDGRGNETVEVLVKQDAFDVNGDYLTSASAGMDQRGQPCVEFTFNSVGGRLFGGLTGSNLPDETTELRRRLAIILNGEVYSAPNIQSTIFDRGEITGSFSRQDVEDLVAVLNAGALPAPLKRVSVSPASK
jgi:SecD/SecF fusion protein